MRRTLPFARKASIHSLFMIAGMWLFLGACTQEVSKETGDDINPDLLVDDDGDGYYSSEDCDDNNSSINPGSVEICDGLDNDCDGEIDEGVTSTWYADTDGDGFGDEGSLVEACEKPEGYVPNGNDCDDSNPDVYPGNTEVCDGVDNNCDGEIDEDLSATWYADADGDGYGDPDSELVTCEEDPEGYVQDATDCDDTTADAHPGHEELCDELDNDCDGIVDEDVSTTYYADTDGDGYGDSSTTTEACGLPTGYSDNAQDCDDTNADINPGQPELCNGVDDDCDGFVDEDDATDSLTWYADADGDGYGDPYDVIESCAQPSGYVSDNTDCDDTTALANPGATEFCDGIDNDCDGYTDEDDAIDVTTWYRDADGDGYGDASNIDMDCVQPSGYVADDTDCDDGRADANPDAGEVCDGVDNDCDGTVDESDASDASAWYRDRDEDGYGDSSSATIACDQPSGYVADSNDCDDRNDAISPAGTETCDGNDEDCDGDVDEDATDAGTWYLDADGDGHGSADDSATACDAPSGYVADSSDCDDGDATVYPGAGETCNGVDDDCDGDVDEGLLLEFYEDADGDGWGDVYSSTEACSLPSGYVENDDDCDDDESSINPSAAEDCDYTDNDCDGDVDEDYRSGGAYVLEAHCGYCDNDCSLYSFDNASPFCETSASAPFCDFTCDSGYYDADGEVYNGCECSYVSADDTPFDGIDADCDGSDGDHAEAIHVSSDTGSASGDGSLTYPLDNIQAGIDLALTEGLSWVLVAMGSYDEDLWLEDGITLYGGYDTDFAQRDATLFTTVIEGTGSSADSPATVCARDISSDTLFDGFTVIGASAAGGGQSAIAVWLQDCDAGLTLANNIIEADDGRDGDDGADGADGDDGSDGVDGTDGAYNDCTDLPYGGSGGGSTCDGTATDGGDGGDAICPSALGSYQGDGLDGVPSSGGGSGGTGACDGYITSTDCSECFIATCWDAGDDGSDGSDGSDGAAGSGASDDDGSISGGVWLGEVFF